MKLSFKKRPKERGLSSVAYPYPAVDIKGDGKEVGWIDPRSAWQDKYYVWMRMVDVNDPIGWRNVCMFECENEEEARQLVKDNWYRLKTRVHQL